MFYHDGGQSLLIQKTQTLKIDDCTNPSIFDEYSDDRSHVLLAFFINESSH